MSVHFTMGVATCADLFVTAFVAAFFFLNEIKGKHRCFQLMKLLFMHKAFINVVGNARLPTFMSQLLFSKKMTSINCSIQVLNNVKYLSIFICFVAVNVSGGEKTVHH